MKVIFIVSILIIISVILFFGYSDIPLNELKTKYTNAASIFISINGMDVHYRDEGTINDSIPLVLIHGTGSSLHTFDAWTNSLKKQIELSEWIFLLMV